MNTAQALRAKRWSITKLPLVQLQTAILLTSCVAMCFVYWLPGDLPTVETVRWDDKALGDGDFGRFVSQGWWLSQGYGYREVSADGDPCTCMAPGYPVFLATMFRITTKLTSIRLTQCGLFLFSVMLLFFSLRRYRPVSAFVISLTIGTSPWMAAQASLLMSEVLGLFWAAILTSALVRLFDRETSDFFRSCCSLVFGASCSALCLTSPVLTPCCFSLICLLVWVLFKHKRSLMKLLAGAAVPMTCWQAHCVYANGRPCLTLLTPLAPVCAVDWINSWAESEQDCVAGYRAFTWAIEPPDLRLLPSYAFRSGSEFAELSHLAKAAANERAGLIDTGAVSALTKRCTEIARERCEQNKAFCMLCLPVQRTVATIWTKRSVNFLGVEDSAAFARLWPSSLFRELSEFGVRRAVFRLGKGLIAVWAWCIHGLIVGYYVYLIAVVIRASDRVLVAFCFAVFSSLFAFGAIGPEARRLQPFLPLVSASIVLYQVRNAGTSGRLRDSG